MGPFPRFHEGKGREIAVNISGITALPTPYPISVNLRENYSISGKISNAEQGILNFEGKKLNNSTFSVRYSIFNCI